jgi:FtsZ-binding cell division protein ZapB
MAASGTAIDALASLEERIRQAVELVSRLRGEKDAAVRDADEARAQAAKASEEVEILRAERQQVRSRIEKLLGKIDQLSGSP